MEKNRDRDPNELYAELKKQCDEAGVAIERGSPNGWMYNCGSLARLVTFKQQLADAKCDTTILVDYLDGMIYYTPKDKNWRDTITSGIVST